MFGFCTDPDSLEGLAWFACYLTTPKHFNFYQSFLTVIGLVLLAVPFILLLGFAGAFARRSSLFPVRAIGQLYTSSVRGVPDIIFFLFVPIALDQGLEYLKHQVVCPDWTEPVRQGNDFLVCTAAKIPLGISPQWVHDSWGFTLALVAYAIVFGAFAATILDGALSAVPKNQLETARRLRFESSPNIGAGSLTTNVGLCASRPIESLDDLDQGHAIVVFARGGRRRVLGARAGQFKNADL